MSSTVTQQIIDAEMRMASVIAMPARSIARAESTLRSLISAQAKTTTNAVDSVEIAAHVADNALSAGRLDEAAAWSGLGLRESVEHKVNSPNAVAHAELVLASTLLERGEFTKALLHCNSALNQSGAITSPQTRIRLALTKASILASLRRRAEAICALDLAESQMCDLGNDETLNSSLLIRCADAALDINDIERASDFYRRSVETSRITWQSRIFSLTLRVARLSLRTLVDDSFALLRQLPASANLRLRLEASIAASCALSAVGERSDAITLLYAALQLAEQQNFVFAFTRHGTRIVSLLQLASEASELSANKSPLKSHLNVLLKRMVEVNTDEPTRLTNVAEATEAKQASLLSSREHEVLDLLKQNKSNREVSATLYLSINTVKTHVKNIYSKLEVNSRDTLIERAQQLGL